MKVIVSVERLFEKIRQKDWENFFGDFFLGSDFFIDIMGIIGLTSLIEVNPHLLSDIELRDTNLIVDGNSFCYQLYNTSRIDSRFGGDYPKFETQIIDFLDRMAAVDVRLTFVFDGYLDTELLKRDTAIQRQRIRLSTAKSMVALNSRDNLLPLNALHALIDILIRRRQEIYQCAGEADGLAAGLANDRKAPLLSQDSDFFIFDLKFGYIPFETLDFDETKTVVRAKLYLLDNLLEHYPTVDRRMLPLFAFLCGNDFSNGCNLKKFFDHIHKPRVDIAGGHGEASSKKKRSKTGVRPMRRHCNMLAIFEWLQDKTDEEKAVDEALNWIEKHRRDKLRETIKRSTEAYRRCEITEPGSTNGFDIAALIKNQISHLNPPRWLVDDYVEGRVPPILFYIRQDRRAFLPVLIEDFSKPSAYDCCRVLRSAVYRILLKNESADRRIVQEYCRDGGQFAKRSVSIDDDSICGSSWPPDLNDLEKLSDLERQRLFFDFFKFSTSDAAIVSKFPQPLTLFVGCLIFWCRSDETRVKRCQALALLISCFWLCSRKSDSDSDSDSDRPLFSKGEERLDDLESEFDYTPNFSTKRGGALAISNVHSFSQWQACFQASTWLDAILRRPFGSAAPIQRLFHGRIIYNLAVYFENAKTEKTILARLFKGAPLLENVFNDLWTLVGKCLPENDSSATGASAGKQKSGKKKNRNKSDVVATNVAETGSAETEVEAKLESSDDDWGLENRFRTLVTLR